MTTEMYLAKYEAHQSWENNEDIEGYIKSILDYDNITYQMSCKVSDLVHDYVVLMTEGLGYEGCDWWTFVEEEKIDVLDLFKMVATLFYENMFPGTGDGDCALEWDTPDVKFYIDIAKRFNMFFSKWEDTICYEGYVKDLFGIMFHR